MSAEDPKPKVLLILELSEDPSTPVGIVKDCHGSMPIDMSTCDVVGTWSRFDKGTFYVELTTPVDALQDILIQLISERVRSGELATYPIIYHQERPVRSSLKAEPAHGVPPTDFTNLRAKLGR